MFGTMGPERGFEQFGDDNLSMFDNGFADDAFFDFNAACDIPLPSVELSQNPPDYNINDVSLANIENSGSDQALFFDSSYASDDMGAWPSGNLMEYPGGIQGGDWAPPPISQVSEIVQASPGHVWSSEPPVIEEPQAAPSREAIAAEIARLQALHDATPAKKTAAPKTPPKKRSQPKTPQHTPRNSITRRASHSRSLSDATKELLKKKGPVERMFGASSSPQERHEYKQKMRASASKNRYPTHDNVNGFTFQGHDFSLQNEDFNLVNDCFSVQDKDFNIQNENSNMANNVRNSEFTPQNNGFIEIDNFIPRDNDFISDGSLAIENDPFVENINYACESNDFVQNSGATVDNNDIVPQNSDLIQNGSSPESNDCAISNDSVQNGSFTVNNNFVENSNFASQHSDDNMQDGNNNFTSENEPMSAEDALLAEQLLAQIAECDNNAKYGSYYPSYNATEQRYAPEHYNPMMTPPRHPNIFYPGINPATFHSSDHQTSSPAANNPVHQEQQVVTSPTPSKKKTTKKAPAKPRAPKEPKEKKPRSPPKPKTAASATKVTKKTKTSSSAPHKRTVSAPSSNDRTIKELFNMPFMSLTKEEKARLLLPLLQGIDPNTGLQVSTPGTLATQEPDFEAIGADEFPEMNAQNSGMNGGTMSQSGAYDTTGQARSGMDGGYQAANVMTSERMSAIQAGHSMINGVPAEALGRDRQIEALERNAMLRAAGRRR